MDHHLGIPAEASTACPTSVRQDPKEPRIEPFLLFVPHVLFLLWTLAVSVVLLLRERGLPVIA